MSVNHNSNKVSNMALNKRKRKLKFRCWHRGSREADLLLGNFVDKYLPDMDISDVEKLEHKKFLKEEMKKNYFYEFFLCKASKLIL